MPLLNNTLKFIRKDCHKYFFEDLDISLNYGLKFDIYDNNIQLGTLVTNNSKMAGLTMDGNKISMKKEFKYWQNKTYYYIFSNNKLIATIVDQTRTFFGKIKEDVLHITFHDNPNFTYYMDSVYYNEFAYKDAHLQYNLLLNGFLECRISNFMKIGFNNSFFYGNLEGIIEYHNGFCNEKLLCLLQFLNFKMWFDQRD